MFLLNRGPRLEKRTFAHTETYEVGQLGADSTAFGKRTLKVSPVAEYCDGSAFNRE